MLIAGRMVVSCSGNLSKTFEELCHLLNRVGLVYGVKRHFQQYFGLFQLYRGGQFYWWRKSVYREKTTDLSQVTHTLFSHNVVSSTPPLSGIRTHNVSCDRH